MQQGLMRRELRGQGEAIARAEAGGERRSRERLVEGERGVANGRDQRAIPVEGRGRHAGRLTASPAAAPHTHKEGGKA
jgi:hypothetical protein